MKMENFNLKPENSGSVSPEVSNFKYPGAEREEMIAKLIDTGITPEQAEIEITKKEIAVTTAQNLTRKEQGGGLQKAA